MVALLEHDDFGWKLAYLVFGMISGALIAGLGGWALMKALAGAGALTSFPSGEERLAAGLDDDEDDDILAARS